MKRTATNPTNKTTAPALNGNGNGSAPIDPLMKKIAAFALPEKERGRASRRVQNGVTRIRDHICGLYGVKATEVSETHVAMFWLKIGNDYSYQYTHFFNIGLSTSEELEKWAEEQIQKSGK